jgi:Fe-S-cluster containining protein
MEGLFVPVDHIETVRLKIYKCLLFIPETGLCGDYSHRPEICRNTICPAFFASDLEEQCKIIKEINDEEFLLLNNLG